MKRIGNLFLLFLLLLLPVFAGCGKINHGTSQGPDDDNSQGQEDSREQASGTEEPGSLLTVSQWKDGFFRNDSPGTAETPYYEILRSEIESPDLDPEADVIREASAYAWDGRYLLTSAEIDGEEHFFLSRQKADLTWEKSREILTDWEDRPEGYAACLDVVNEDLRAVLYAKKEAGHEKQPEEYYLLLLNKKGELQSVQPVTDAYQAAGISEETLTPGRWWCDQNGYQYLLPERNRLVVINPEGKTAFEKICSEDTGEAVAAGFHMPDGSPVFSLGSLTNGTRLIRLDLPGGEEHILWEAPSMWLRQFTVTPEGILYYAGNDSLWAWNLTNGREKRLLSLDALELSPNDLFQGEQTLWAAVDEKGTLLLYDLDGQRVSVLQGTLPGDEDSLICAMVNPSLFINSCTSLFSGQYDGKKIRCSSYPSTTAESWTRFSAEVAANNLPDLMVLSHDQMLILAEKGVLAPLDDLMSKDSPEKLLSGLREAGTIDGNLYGIPAEQLLWGMIVSDRVWPGTSWTVEDILNLCDSGELNGLICGDGPEFTLQILCGALTGDIPYYDPEAGESRFEDPEFIRLLEACRKYGNGANISGDARDLLEDGTCLASVEWFPNISVYVNTWQQYGEGFHFVGFPEQKDRIGVYNNTCFLSAAKGSKDTKEIGAFLDYVLSDEAQGKVQQGQVTRSALENLFWLSEYNGEFHCMYYGPDGSVFSLPVKADGTSYVTDYLGLADNAEIMVSDEDVVWSIIKEETVNFWNGSRSAEETARIIDNRVQLYLNER